MWSAAVLSGSPDNTAADHIAVVKAALAQPPGHKPGTRPGRMSAKDITIYKSLGVAIEDVALAVRVYERAKQKGVGVTLPDLSG